MRHFKFFLLALCITVSSNFYAGTTSEVEPKRSAISYEIQKMLKDSNLIIEEEFQVTVIFKVNAEKKIEIRKITSPNPEVNAFLQKRLNGQKLYGDQWSAEMIYELPVSVQAVK